MAGRRRLRLSRGLRQSPRPACRRFWRESWRGDRLWFKRSQIAGEVVGRGAGVRVVLAEDLAAACQCVLVQLTCRTSLAKCAQVAGEIVGRSEGVRVILTQDLAAAGQGVFVQRSCRVQLTGNAQVVGEVIGCAESAGVVIAEGLAAADQGVFVQFPRCLDLPECVHVGR